MPKAKVRVGLEVLLAEGAKRLQGLRVGLVLNQTAVNHELKPAVELLRGAGVEVTALFGPEHGVWGEAQDQEPVPPRPDPLTGLPVHSLYGGSVRPTPTMLEEIDALVFDIQDVGARYYTFIYTMAYAMEACAETRKPFFVLDRPNPLAGMKVEGNLVEESCRSFVGRYPLPARHGMTVGELARYFNAHFQLGCDLTVIPLEGWERRLWYDETDLPWVMPSPNMPTLETATVYPGLCLVEGTNLSEGRGTTRPFELVGAPFLDPPALARGLEAEELPGVRFRPCYFRPTFHKWEGERCGGVQLHVTDREAFQPYLTGLAVLRVAREMAPEFRWREPPYEDVTDRLPVEALLGSVRLRQALEAGTPLAELERSWTEELREFQGVRRRFLLY